MGRYGECDLLLRDTEMLGGTGFDQRKNLQALDRAPGEEREPHVPTVLDDLTERVDEAPSPAVDGLDRPASPYLGDDGVVGDTRPSRQRRRRRES